MNKIVRVLSAVMALAVVFGICSCGKRSSKVSVQRGDTVTFGTYEGRKIEWIVLDTGDNGALLIAKEGLDAKQMDDETGTAENIWEDCDLRTWLNDEFYKESFTEDEQKKINKIQKQIKACEEKIATLEARLDELGKKLEDPANASDMKLVNQYTETQEALDKEMETWEELSLKLE